MPFQDYSTNPEANITIGGLYVGNNCPPGNIDNAIRQLAADGKALADQIGGGAASMPVTGGAFKGPITREGAGAYLHHASGSYTDGRFHILAQGSPRPSNPGEGAIVLYYA